MSAKAMARAKAVVPRRAKFTNALKAAETDATKRALATFGKPFGLELYRKDKNIALAKSPAIERAAAQPAMRVALRFTPRRYDPHPAAIALSRPAAGGLDD